MHLDRQWEEEVPRATGQMAEAQDTNGIIDWTLPGTEAPFGGYGREEVGSDWTQDPAAVDSGA